MAPKPETLDRLLLSRSLVAPLRFKPASDRFAVAAHVLAAHDAAELAIAAVCTELSVSGISDTRTLSLPDYLGRLREHAHPTRDVSFKDYINQLNRVRVDLKHHGIRPDKIQWGTVAEKVFGHISTWCQQYLNLDYATLDAADLISAESIKDVIRAAQQYIKQDQFKECLERLAEAISRSSLELFPIGIHINAGDASAETALSLSGYGVDPARFITLQRLLPTYGGGLFLDDTVEWKKTQYGHHGNWTREKAEFAYEETINLLLRLQEANPYPTPYLYNDVFKSVVVVKKESPDVTVLHWGLDGWFEREEYGLAFAVGDRIECMAYGAPVIPVDDPERFTGDPEKAQYVVALHALSDKFIDDVRPVLIFKREDVEIQDVDLYEG